MSQPVERAELFLHFTRRKMTALLAVVIVVGAVGLTLMLTPTGTTWRTLSRVALLPVALAIVVVVQLALRNRRWRADSPEVKLAMEDEWRRTNMDRATRTALIVVLVAQWPMAIALGFLGDVPQPRGAMAMAMATITLGLATQLGSYLWFDRD